MPESREQRVIMAGAALAVVVGVFNGVAPSVADVHAAPADDDIIYANAKMATALAVGACGTLSLLTKDPTTFIVGGMGSLIMASWLMYANHQGLPHISKLVAPTGAASRESASTVTPAAEPAAVVGPPKYM
jgi:hypothetical protein